MRSRAWVLPASLLALCVALLVSDLWLVWSLEKISYFAIAGLVPYSDAHGYLRGARSLVELGHIDEWSSRRPLYTSFLAALYWLCDGALRPVLLLQTLAAAGAVWAAVRELGRRAGVAAAVLCAVAIHLHYSEYAASTMSESLGVILGALAFAFFCRGFAAPDRAGIAAGMFLLSLALSARSGAYLSLPLLVLYGAFVTRERGWIDAKGLALSSLAALAGLVASPLLLLVIGPERYGYQGNFSYTLYGLATGGGGWTHVLSVHPELLELSSDKARSDAIYQLAIEQVKRSPSTLLLTIAAKWWEAFRSPLAVLYGFAPSWKLPLLVPAAAGLVVVVRDLRSGAHRWGFLAPGLLGVFLSMPVLVDGGDRVQAATVPFNCALAAIGLGALVALVRKGARQEPPAAPRATPLWVAGGGVVLVCVAGPMLLKLSSPGPSPAVSWTCEAGEVPMLYRHHDGEGVALSPITVQAISRSPLFTSPVPDVPASGEFRSILDLVAADENEYTYLFLPDAHPRTQVSRSEPQASEDHHDSRRVQLCSRVLFTSEFAHHVYRSRAVGVEPE